MHTNGQQLQPLAKVMLALGMLGKLPVESVSHEKSVSAPAVGVNAAYGEYLVNINDCRTCHGQNLAGGIHPDPSVKAVVPNITPGGAPGFWTQEQFIATIRTGTPPGSPQLDTKLMPWQTYRLLSDEELQAIWLYLQSLPKLENNL